MAFGLDDILSWIGDTASSAGQGVADAATGVGQGIGDAAAGIGDYLGNLTSSFGADPTSSQFPAIPQGQDISTFVTGDTVPQIAGTGSDVSQPDFSGINPGTPVIAQISPSTPILANAAADPFADGGSMKGNDLAKGVAGGDWFNSSGGGAASGIGGLLKNNASWLLPAAGIGAAALKSQTPLAGTGTLKANAAALTDAAGPLMNPLTKGSPLPGGAQAGLDAAAASMTASIKSRHASSGTSGSSMEAQELAQVPRIIQQQQLAEAQTLYAQGLQTLGMADQATQQIMQNTLSQDAALTNALARMAASMAPTALKDLTAGL